MTDPQETSHAAHPSERIQSVLAQPVADQRAADGLKRLKREACKEFLASVPDLGSLLNTGSEKPELSAAYSLLVEEHGTQRAAQLESSCPTCKTGFKTKQSLADRKRHHQSCQAKVILAYLEEKTFQLAQKRGCPWSGCSTKWTAKHNKATIEKHMYQCHPNQRAVCGLETDDGDVCQFSGGKEELDSMDTALLTIHREVAHGWPGPPNRSVHFDTAENRFVIGYTEVQLHCAAKCPADHETLTSTTASLPTEVCPVCFMDPQVAPLCRLESIKGTMIHLWVHHLLDPAQKYGSADEVVLCCCCNEGVPVWDFLAHLQRAGFNTTKRGPPASDPLDGLRDAGPHYAEEWKAWLGWAKGARKDAERRASSPSAAKSPAATPLNLSRIVNRRNTGKRGKKRSALAEVTNTSDAKKHKGQAAQDQSDDTKEEVEGIEPEKTSELDFVYGEPVRLNSKYCIQIEMTKFSHYLSSSL